MCGDGRHPPEAWGHLTYVRFFQDDDLMWHVDLQADDMPDKHFHLSGDIWFDQEGVEVTDPVGVAFLNLRCFGS